MGEDGWKELDIWKLAYFLDKEPYKIKIEFKTNIYFSCQY